MPRTADGDDRTVQVQRLKGGYEAWRAAGPKCAEVHDILLRMERVLATLTTDTTRACPRCGAHFLFGERDAGFYAAQGWPPPRYCRTCRTARKLERDNYVGPIAE
jgi:hypothetical protein